MASPIYFFLYFYCCFFGKPFVHGALLENHRHVIKLKSLQPSLNCSSSSRGHEQQSRGMQITHRYGNPHKIMFQDQFRVSSMIINSKTTTAIHPTESGSEGTRLSVYGRSIGAGNYVVNVSFGTPKTNFALILDTGSGFSWVRCAPCSSGTCYNPSSSSTFSDPPCSNPPCRFSIKYADKSYSNGRVVRDTLTLTPSDVFRFFIFGCSQDYSVDGFGTAAGMMGLGKDGDGLSLISQTASNFGSIFCYCLPAIESSTGHLLFGLDALKTCQTKISTPLLANPNWPALYFVNLIGITIGDKRLMVSSFVSSSPITTIYSGTVITRLPASVYSELRDTFRGAMSTYPMAPPEPPLLDTCYNVSMSEDASLSIPAVVLHFATSTNIVLDPSGVLWRPSDTKLCLAFAGNKKTNDLTIIGNNQQQKLNILFNIQDERVEFGTGGC